MNYEIKFEEKLRSLIVVIFGLPQLIIAVCFYPIFSFYTSPILSLVTMAVILVSFIADFINTKTFIVTELIKSVLLLTDCGCFAYNIYKDENSFPVICILISLIMISSLPYYYLKMKRFRSIQKLDSFFLEMDEKDYKKHLSKCLCGIIAIQIIFLTLLLLMPQGLKTPMMIHLHVKLSTWDQTIDYSDFSPASTMNNMVYVIIMSLILLLEWFSNKAFVVLEVLKFVFSIITGIYLTIIYLSYPYAFFENSALICLGIVISLFLPFYIYIIKLKKYRFAIYYNLNQTQNDTSEEISNERNNI